jgi:hypothetical protein
MQVRSTSVDLLAGDPVCSPSSTVMVESTIHLIRLLHKHDSWLDPVNECIVERLQHVGHLVSLMSGQFCPEMEHPGLETEESEEKKSEGL